MYLQSAVLFKASDQIGTGEATPQNEEESLIKMMLWTSFPAIICFTAGVGVF